MIAIKLASSRPYTSPVYADLAKLRQHSTCAKELPEDAAEWDVSNFSVLGQSVHAHTIRAWLSTLSRLGANSKNLQMHTMIGLAQLLGFADAVGSSSEVFQAIDASVSAAAGFAAEVQIKGASRYTIGFCQSRASSSSSFCFSTRDGKIWQLRPTACSAANSITEASRVLGEQVEPLLYLAYKLQMPRLQQVLLKFLSSTWWLDMAEPSLGSCFCALHDPEPALNVLLDRAEMLDGALSARVCEAAKPAASNSSSGGGISSTERAGHAASTLAALQQQLDKAQRTAASRGPPWGWPPGSGLLPERQRRHGAPALLVLQPVVEGVLYILGPTSEVGVCLALAGAMLVVSAAGVTAVFAVVTAVGLVKAVALRES